MVGDVAGRDCLRLFRWQSGDDLMRRPYVTLAFERLPKRGLLR